MNTLPNELVFLIGKEIKVNNLLSFLLISKRFSKTFKLNLITKKFFRETYEIHKVDYYLKKNCEYVFKQPKTCKKEPKSCKKIYYLKEIVVVCAMIKGIRTIHIETLTIKTQEVGRLIENLYSRDPNKCYEIFMLLNKFYNLKYNNPDYNNILSNLFFPKHFIEFNKGKKIKIQGIGIVEINDKLEYHTKL